MSNFILKNNIIVFSDLDGTALKGNHMFSDKLKEVVEKLYSKGIYFCPVTARSTSDAIRQAKILNIDKFKGFVAANNGSQIYSFKDNEWILDKKVPNEVIQKTFEKTFGKVGKFKVHYFADDITYVYGEGENSRYWSDIMKVDYKVIQSIDEIKKPINHLTIVLSKDVTIEKSEAFLKNFREQNESVDIFKYTRRVFEVCPKVINKGTAVKFICNHLNLNKKDTTSFAFGDSHNDFDLFSKVDYGIAMQNAIEELITHADGITEFSNDEDGVALFIEKHILQKGDK